MKRPSDSTAVAATVDKPQFDAPDQPVVPTGADHLQLCADSLSFRPMRFGDYTGMSYTAGDTNFDLFDYPPPLKDNGLPTADIVSDDEE